jgi:hypothetical protein
MTKRISFTTKTKFIPDSGKQHRYDINISFQTEKVLLIEILSLTVDIELFSPWEKEQKYTNIFTYMAIQSSNTLLKEIVREIIWSIKCKKKKSFQIHLRFRVTTPLS